MTVLVTDPAQLWPVVQHVQQCLEAIDRTLSRFCPNSELARLERIVDLPQLASPLFLIRDNPEHSLRTTGIVLSVRYH